MTDYHERHSGTIFSRNTDTDPAPSSMAERVARAIYKSHLENFSGPVIPAKWDTLPDCSKHYGLALARAAISAMRTPTQEMAMVGHYVSSGELSDLQAKVVFIAMIEESLT